MTLVIDLQPCSNGSHRADPQSLQGLPVSTRVAAQSLGCSVKTIERDVRDLRALKIDQFLNADGSNNYEPGYLKPDQLKAVERYRRIICPLHRLKPLSRQAAKAAYHKKYCLLED